MLVVVRSCTLSAPTQKGRFMKSYEIRIACPLSETIRAAFPELTAVSLSPTVTMLSGPVKDQSQLHEFVARIADMGIEITEVRQQV
jgi:hypothetical protein